MERLTQEEKEKEKLQDNLILRTLIGSKPKWIGRRGWYELIDKALGFPAPYVTEQDRKDTSDYFYSYAKTFGCLKCSKDMLLYMEQNPLDLTNRATLFWWVWAFHNYVNKKLGKPFFTREEAIQKYLIDAEQEYQDIISINTSVLPIISTKKDLSLEIEKKDSNITGLLFLLFLLLLFFLMGFGIAWLLQSTRKDKKYLLKEEEEQEDKRELVYV